MQKLSKIHLKDVSGGCSCAGFDYPQVTDMRFCELICCSGDNALGYEHDGHRVRCTPSNLSEVKRDLNPLFDAVDGGVIAMELDCEGLGLMKLN